MTSMFGHGADWRRLAEGHAAHGNTPSATELAALAKRYIKCGLMHRISIGDFLAGGGAQMVADAGGNGSFASFVAEWGPFLDGVALPFGPSPGRLSSVQAPAASCGMAFNKHTKAFTNCTPSARSAQVTYWRNLTHRFDSRGWLPLLFDYTVDEPSCHPEDGESEGTHSLELY